MYPLEFSLCATAGHKTRKGVVMRFKLLRPLWRTLVLGLSLILMASFVHAEEPVYLKYNIHAQQGRDIKASYACWIDPGAGHIIIPAGTQITVSNRGKFRNGFRFETKEGMKVFFEFDRKRMNMNEEEYLGLITSPTPVSLKSFSQVDQKGIKEGKPYKGMTRKGIMTALGYPAVHRTPSLDAANYVYWRNRFATTAIEFDGSGKVVSIR
jgi:hypothetical protein